MDPIKIICICGSGVAGANIIMYKLREAFEKRGIPIKLITGGVSSVSGLVGSGNVDMIVSTSMMRKFEGVPYFQAIPFYTGEGEEELLEEIIQTAAKIWQQRNVETNNE